MHHLALVVLSLLPPVIFVRSREPFERLVVILELVLGRTAGRDQPLPVPSTRRESAPTE
jgi:hypothetical protein